MFLILVAILSIIIALIRKGSFSNILHSGIKASFLFVISLLLFIAIQVGHAADIAIINEWAYFINLGAYLSLCIGIILNVNLWMMIMLIGTLSNFVVTFINEGKMPVSLETLTAAGLTESFIETSHNLILATSTTRLPFLGAVVPLPLPSIFADVLSPGTIVLGIGLFMVIQNVLLGIVYEYEDDEEDDEPEPKQRTEKRNKRKEKDADGFFYDDFDDDGGEEFNKDYTIGNININDLDMDDDIDESLFTTELPPTFDTDIESENEMTDIQTAPAEIAEPEPTRIVDHYDEEEIDYEQLKQVMNLERASETPTESESTHDDILTLIDDLESESSFDQDDYGSEEIATVSDEETDYISHSELFENSEITYENIEDLYADETEETIIESLYQSEFQTETDDEEEDTEEPAYTYTESFYQAEKDFEDVTENDGYINYIEESEYDEPEEDEFEEDEYEEVELYDLRETEDLTFSTGAIKEAQEVINNDIPKQQETSEYNRHLMQDEPLEVDTDSPFIIVEGRIVENPYYKFRKGSQRETSDIPVSAQKQEGVYVMKSAPQRMNNRPNFAPPSRNIRKETVEDHDVTPDSGYEKVEMKIGDVQIKFWKKDNE